MKVYFCYEYQKEGDSITPPRVKKIFKDYDKCFEYCKEKETKEMIRLSKVHNGFDMPGYVAEKIHELEVEE